MASERMNDGELVEKCKRGDSRAWKIMVARLTPQVYRLSMRMLGSGRDVEDACQEVFLRMIRSLHAFDVERPLRPWVYRIAYHVCLRKLGKMSEKMSLPTEPGQLALVQEMDRPNPEQSAASKETDKLLLDALDSLSVQDRALVELRYRAGLSENEVAEVADMPVNTVKTRLHRARARLKQKLSKIFQSETA